MAKKETVRKEEVKPPPTRLVKDSNTNKPKSKRNEQR